MVNDTVKLQMIKTIITDFYEFETDCDTENYLGGILSAIYSIVNMEDK